MVFFMAMHAPLLWVRASLIYGSASIIRQDWPITDKWLRGYTGKSLSWQLLDNKYVISIDSQNVISVYLYKAHEKK